MQKFLKITLALMLMLLAGCSSDNSEKEDKEKQESIKEVKKEKGGLLYTTDDKIISFKNGYSVVKSTEGSVGVGLIDPKGNEIMPLKYDSIDFIDDELLKVKMDNKIGVYDIKGQELIPTEYDDIRDFTDDGNYTLAKKNEKEYVIDRKGDIVKELKNNIYCSILYDYILIVDKSDSFQGSEISGVIGIADINDEDIRHYDEKYPLYYCVKGDYLINYVLGKTICFSKSLHQIDIKNIGLDDIRASYGDVLKVQAQRGQANKLKLYNTKSGEFTDAICMDIAKIAENKIYGAESLNGDNYVIHIYDNEGIENSKIEINGKPSFEDGYKMFSVGIGNGYYLYTSDGKKVSDDKYKMISFLGNNYLSLADASDNITIITDEGKKLDIKGELGGDIRTNDIYLERYNGKEIGKLTTNDEGIFFYQENNGKYEVYGFYK